MIKFNNIDTRITSMTSSDVFIVNFEHISLLLLVFLFWLFTNKCFLGYQRRIQNSNIKEKMNFFLQKSILDVRFGSKYAFEICFILEYAENKHLLLIWKSGLRWFCQYWVCNMFSFINYKVLHQVLTTKSSSMKVQR